MAKNIFQIAKECKYKKIVFRRATWGIDSFGIVDKVIINRRNVYGHAFGRIHYSNGNEVDGEISCAGNYSWNLVEVLEEEMEVEYE